MAHDIIDTTQEDKKQKKDNRKRERELSDIRRILQLPEGRRFYWRIMEKGAVFHDVFAGTDTNGTCYNLGRQSISRDFLNDMLEASPDSLGQMQNERKAERQSEEVLEKLEEKKQEGA